MQNHVQIFIAHPLLPFFFSGCRLRSTWSGEIGQMRKFHEKMKKNCTYLSLAQKKLGVKREKKRKTKYGHHLLFPFTHPSCLLREKPKQVVVSCSGQVLEPFLALKVSVTSNLRVLPSVLSADSSSNVNQF